MSRAAVTIRHVAEKAKVSTATVSRVLNNDPRVRQKTRQAVLDAMKSLGYTLNVVARSLKTNRTHTIGIVAPELAGDFLCSLQRA